MIMLVRACSVALPLNRASLLASWLLGRGLASLMARWLFYVGNQGSLKNSNSHIDASHSRQPLVKGERLVRAEVNAATKMPGH